MLPFLKGRLQRLGSQLTFIFLVGFLGVGLAIGLPVILLISQQSSSYAQLLLNQALVASRAYMEREKSDLQSLALLISQRPTLIQLLNQQDLSSLEGYLETLREGANTDFVLVCAGGNETSGTDNDLAALCQLDPQAGYAILPASNTLYLYATADVSAVQKPPQIAFVGKRASTILAGLHEETGLLYFLLLQDQMVDTSDLSIQVSPTLAADLQQGVNSSPNRSLRQRSFEMDGHRYILSDQEIDSSLGLH